MLTNTPQTARSSVDDLIIGAGLAAIGYAHFTSHPYFILEKEDFVGGVASSRVRDGYTFDCTGHWLHLQHTEIKNWVDKLFPEGLLEVSRRAEIHLANQRTPYPFQANTYGLPPNIVSDCVLGFFRARERQAAGDFTEPKSFEDFIRQRMGDGIAEHFMIPYNTKMWTIAPSEMSHQWCGRFVPLPTAEEVVQGALMPAGSGRPLGYNSTFFYPKSGGIHELAKRLSKPLSPNIKCRSAAHKIDWKKKTVHTEDGASYSYKRLISTIPLPQLAQRLVDAPEVVRKAASQLRSTSVTYWNMGFEGPAKEGTAHWVYFPEKHIPFYRVGSPSAAIPSTAPQGHRSYYVETSHPTGTPSSISDDAILDGLRDVGLTNENEEPAFMEKHTIPCAYVIMDEAYGHNRDTLMTWLNEHDIWSVGRYGAWTYDSMEGALVQGKTLAEKLNNSQS